MEFVQFLRLWTERQELEMGTSENRTTPRAKSMAEPSHLRVHLTDPIDLEEEEDEMWDNIMMSERAPVPDVETMQRIDHLENVLMEVVKQLKLVAQQKSSQENSD